MSHRHLVRPNQSGQVLPLMTVVLVLMVGMMYFTVNSAQMVAEKIRVTNVADAAAYSAATVEARALNYMAYANRAIVANQVAIAQALSLASWTNYFADVWMNLERAEVRHLELLPPDDLLRWATLQAAFAGQAIATSSAGVDPRVIAQTVNTAAGALITSADLASRGLALSGRLVRESIRAAHVRGSLARPAWIATEVARATDPAIQADLLPTSEGVDPLIAEYAGPRRARLADVVLRSRDPFTRERAWELHNLFGFLGSRRFERTGGTELRDFDRWEAEDDLTFRYRTFSLFGGRRRSEQIAAGFATVGPTTESGAPRAIYRLPARFSGIPSTYDIDHTRRGELLAHVTVRATKPRNQTLTAGGVARVKPSGALALFDGGAAAGELAALSRAEIFFERPISRDDESAELGNLFNPYWRVRLAPPTDADRALAAVLQGGVFIP
jgi:hypothetical protein